MILFQLLKGKPGEKIELAYPDYSRNAPKMELTTDASGVGSEACLLAVQDGQLRVIDYASMCVSVKNKEMTVP